MNGIAPGPEIGLACCNLCIGNLQSSGNFLFYYAKDSGSKELLFSVVASAYAPADKSTELLYISETDTYLSYIVNPSLSASLREKLIPASELKESITVRGIITAG